MLRKEGRGGLNKAPTKEERKSERLRGGRDQIKLVKRKVKRLISYLKDGKL